MLSRTVQKSFLVYAESWPAVRIARADERHGARLSSTDQAEAPGHQGRMHVGHVCRPVTRARVREDCSSDGGPRQVWSIRYRRILGRRDGDFGAASQGRISCTVRALGRL